MQRKITLTFFVIALSLGACSFAEGTVPLTATPDLPPTETPLPPPTQTETPLVTATAAEPPTVTPTTAPPTVTNTPLPPENAADCVNAGRFIADVTIPDNSNVSTNSVVTKTWRIQNVGTCIWWYGYTVAHYSEFDFGAQDGNPLPFTNPGETADISVDLQVPGIEGLYRGNFVIQNPAGLPIELEGDSRLWVVFNAVNDGVGQPTSTTEATATADVAATSTEESAEVIETPSAACAYTPDEARIQQVLAEINAYRAESNLSPYVINENLMQAAQVQAVDMACNRLFVHEGSDGSTPETRATAAGYAGTVAENFYGSYPPFTPQEVTDWWRLDQSDPRHNENLLSASFTEVGIGYAFYEDFGFYTVVFGTP